MAGPLVQFPGGVILFFVVHMSIGYLMFAGGPSHDVFISLLFFFQLLCTDLEVGQKVHPSNTIFGRVFGTSAVPPKCA